MPHPTLKPLIISAPFGNYIQPSGATPTLGTFTAAARSGRVWRILKTVRYSWRMDAWVNKIGLRNPGIDWLVARIEAGKIDASDKIVSIHGFTAEDWTKLLGQITAIKPLAVELNISCPNVGEMDWPVNLFADAVATGVPVIVKVPPVNYAGIFRQAIEAGVRVFHCCNTLPVPAGGISGQPLVVRGHNLHVGKPRIAADKREAAFGHFVDVDRLRIESAESGKPQKVFDDSAAAGGLLGDFPGMGAGLFPVGLVSH